MGVGACYKGSSKIDGPAPLVVTPYGVGQMTAVYGNGIRRVKLAFGDAYIHETDVTAVDAKTGPLVKTPYGIGKLTSIGENEIRSVDLAFGTAYIHARDVSATIDDVQTPYGKGTLMESNGKMCKVKLPFGEASMLKDCLVRSSISTAAPAP
eukprot:CAMPEP_0167827232 /NCGR_PEP_ID=MMETSP0112_2-20121227/10570_1 /TAXON_ID=91324 /ORGANISM="Lotharella globosa, Strain CCCM811" /LENGTH=151 /DNA_ID=CAMNT_0007729953 /DNA_START=14 /DNA_END=469 /DNA_ORIENTATION=+